MDGRWKDQVLRPMDVWLDACIWAILRGGKVSRCILLYVYTHCSAHFVSCAPASVQDGNPHTTQQHFSKTNDDSHRIYVSRSLGQHWVLRKGWGRDVLEEDASERRGKGATWLGRKKKQQYVKRMVFVSQ